MSRIVVVHGIGQQLKGPDTLTGLWLPALRDGLHAAGVRDDSLPVSLSVAFYGGLFRGKALGDPQVDPLDALTDFEFGLLRVWCDGAGIATGAGSKGLRSPQLAQGALVALCRSKFFAGLTVNALRGDLRQVRRYFEEPYIRREARRILSEAIQPDTVLVVGHSLGTVVAYEVLCAGAHPVDTFVTLGSPLGLPNLVFDRLEPPPAFGRGVWPPSVRRWVNIADLGDPVAAVKALAPLFGEGVVDTLVDNEAHAHDVAPYLTAKATGCVIAEALGIQ